MIEIDLDRHDFTLKVTVSIPIEVYGNDEDTVEREAERAIDDALKEVETVLKDYIDSKIGVDYESHE